MLTADERMARIVAAEEWAAGKMRAALTVARASYRIPAHRSARYRDLEPWFIEQLAAPMQKLVERALQWILEAIEADTYGVARDPLPDVLAPLVNEGLAHVGRTVAP